MSSPRSRAGLELHRLRHVHLHDALSDLLADYWFHHGEEKQPETTTVHELIVWSAQQVLSPEEGGPH